MNGNTNFSKRSQNPLKCEKVNLVGLSGCRTNGMSDQRDVKKYQFVGPTGCRTNGMLDHRIGPLNIAYISKQKMIGIKTQMFIILEG